MKNRQLQGNIITYSAAISACGRGQEWQHALRLLTQLWEWHLEANVITYNAGITACEKGSQWHIALKLMEELQENWCLDFLDTFSENYSLSFGKRTHPTKILFPKRLGTTPGSRRNVSKVLFSPTQL